MRYRASNGSAYLVVRVDSGFHLNRWGYIEAEELYGSIVSVRLYRGIGEIVKELANEIPQNG
jgi:hypothetical protein